MAAGVKCGRQEPRADFKGVEGSWETSSPHRTGLNGRRHLVPVCTVL